MRTSVLSCLLFFSFLAAAVAQPATLPAPIIVETQHVSVVLTVGENQKLYQTYLGTKLADAADYRRLPNRHEAYVTAGTDNLFEPAIRLLHPDGNPSLALVFADKQVRKMDDNVTETIIRLRDPQYPVEVTLHFAAFFREDVIKTWTEIRHREKSRWCSRATLRPCCTSTRASTG